MTFLIDTVMPFTRADGTDCDGCTAWWFESIYVLLPLSNQVHSCIVSPETLSCYGASSCTWSFASIWGKRNRDLTIGTVGKRADVSPPSPDLRSGVYEPWVFSNYFWNNAWSWGSPSGVVPSFIVFLNLNRLHYHQDHIALDSTHPYYQDTGIIWLGGLGETGYDRPCLKLLIEVKTDIVPPSNGTSDFD